MTNVFYGIMTILFVAYLVFILELPSVDYKYELYEFNEHVVVSKMDRGIMHPPILVIQSDSSRNLVKVEDVLYNQYQVGDTVQVSKTDRGW